ncbi:MAG: FecR domain-containing protein [Synechococcaceae cyanobacterium SM2_3_1]|nr:FecR domain-containing protein [Synechococcaceae cyanobacterium SM2_3_1]
MIKKAVGWALLLSLIPSTSLQAQPITSAEVIDIPRDPVFAWQAPGPEQPAEVGMRVQEGGYLRTVAPGKAQVKLSNGLFFRLGGDATLQITPSLDLKRGQIIAWGEQPSAELRRIETPTATAAIRGTTVFIETEPQFVRFFCWEGEVLVSLPDGSETVTLLEGEQIIVPVGATSLPEPTKLSQSELQEQFDNSVLLNDFTAPMKTMPQIRQMISNS